ncbi:MAG TPA: TerC family protein [Gemmatimonadaceae bacterium]|nr:TerC family protein [Gemmatimonadaceae bacterium]
MNSLWGWIGFNIAVLAILALDLGILHKRNERVSLREAATWSAVWVSLSLTFAFFVWRTMGREPGLQFLTGYLIEYALSVDNIFVFVLIFTYFKVPDEYQHRVLFWGILGALLLRGIMIIAGSALVSRFAWTLYIFGAFLVFTGIKMALQKDGDHYNPEKDPVLRLARKMMPVTKDYHGDSFFVEQPDATGKIVKSATPLFIVLILVNTTDIIFATDSIPAIFAVTRDPFIIYTSNICAVLGLRALYFLLANVVDKFAYLKLGLSLVLIFIGAKMLFEHFLHIPIVASLGVVGAILATSILASLRWPRPEHAAAAADPPDPKRLP